MAKKRIIILGSTGSIGKRTLDVIRDFKDDFEVVGISAYNSIDILKKQAEEFKPQVVSIVNEDRIDEWKQISQGLNIKSVFGEKGLVEIIENYDFDIVVVSTVGAIGTLPTLKAIEKGKTVALANKEVLVMAGDIVMKKAKENNVPILPIDSEHNAVFQCLFGNKTEDIERIILTASGGPFRQSSIDEIKSATPKEALKHPTWEMGQKITIDSATLMNKGFEVIECQHLFNIPVEKIEVVIHPQSIIHSMVEYHDGSIIAQMGKTDMYMPIQNVLFHPKRMRSNLERLKLSEIGSITFESPDTERFPCLKYAYDAVKSGGTMPTVLNAANEKAVELFLKGKILLFDISVLIKKVMNAHKIIKHPNLDDILKADSWARNEAIMEYNNIKK